MQLYSTKRLGAAPASLTAPRLVLLVLRCVVYVGFAGGSDFPRLLGEIRFLAAWRACVRADSGRGRCGQSCIDSFLQTRKTCTLHASCWVGPISSPRGRLETRPGDSASTALLVGLTCTFGKVGPSSAPQLAGTKGGASGAKSASVRPRRLWMSGAAGGEFMAPGTPCPPRECVVLWGCPLWGPARVAESPRRAVGVVRRACPREHWPGAARAAAADLSSTTARTCPQPAAVVRALLHQQTCCRCQCTLRVLGMGCWMADCGQYTPAATRCRPAFPRRPEPFAACSCWGLQGWTPWQPCLCSLAPAPRQRPTTCNS